jgi:hypothetical protein
MVQAWTGTGDAIGSPVAISPADWDAIGPPAVVAVGDDRAVVGFTAMTGERIELLAVSLDVL